MKYSQAKVEKLQTSPSLPHRFIKKELPRIAERIIPFHNIDIRQVYQGKIQQLLLPEQWAYIPLKIPKKAANHRIFTQQSDPKFTRISVKSSDNFRSTSELFLKKYLKRKQIKQLKQSRDLTNSIGLREKRREKCSSFLQGIIETKDNKLQKYKSESSMQRSKQKNEDKAHIRQSTFEEVEIDQFRLSKMKLKQKLQCYQSSVKNKKAFVKLADRRFKHIHQIQAN